MTMIFDTPESIAFVRACSRKAALSMEIAGIPRKSHQRSAYSIVKEVYGLHGSREAVLAELDEYIETTLMMRKWPVEYGERIAGIVTEATERAIEEHGTLTTKDPIDANIQMLFDCGAITEQEGNDACLLLWTEVVRKFAGNR